MGKKILGLDLGITSIGWALTEEREDGQAIIRMGTRIIPLNIDDKDEFTKGNAISKNQKRTLRRTQRKGYDRYQLRRDNLKTVLFENGMHPDETLRKLQTLKLWGLRAGAVTKQISLTELGRVLLHLNQKRGYKSSRSDANLDKKDTDYVSVVKNRHQELQQRNLTIGQYFFNALSHDENFRTKQLVYPREAYVEEFDAIMAEQKKHYPDLLNSRFIQHIRNNVIYYQRKLKSQKGLVSICEFEGFWINKKDAGNKEKQYFVGPKVTPRSSPLFQVEKIWESINTIIIKNKNRSELKISQSQKHKLFDYLDNNEKLTESELFKILEITKSDGWYGNKMTAKGIQGNLTKVQIKHITGPDPSLLNFSLTLKEDMEREVFAVDKKTAEIIGTNTYKEISPSIEQEPLFKLWHIIYSIADIRECSATIEKKFNINTETAYKLANLDFTKSGFGNKSSKAIRKILPYLMEGFFYSKSASFAGYNHSNYETTNENLKRTLFSSLPNLGRNSLRQPIVEKILNQMINIVNSVIDEKRGWVSKMERQNNLFEVRIELARELKQSKEERNDAFKYITKRDNENKGIVAAIESIGIKATRSRIHKYRMFFESTESANSVNSTCIYCGKGFGITDALSGNNIDVEHIIPKSKLFDDSQSNKTLSHRACNEAKGDRTAYDYMRSKSENELHQFIERASKILSKNKKSKLLASHEDYLLNKSKNKVSEAEKQLWEGFIDRQLRETQYIAKKAVEILKDISLNVWSTSGNVTSYLRDRWGWDDVTMNLQLPKYRVLGLTIWKEWETNHGQKHKKEIIKDWSKRDDHRHHAIDALVIACTKQSFIQRLNTLSSQLNRDEMFLEVGKQDGGEGRISLLDRYIIAKRPFTTRQVEDVVSKILISFKAGKKVATIAKRKIIQNGKKVVVQQGIVVPRGALSEEFVYGKIKTIEKNRSIKHLIENNHLIVDIQIKRIVAELLDEYKGDTNAAVASLKKKPLFIDEKKTEILEFAHCFKEQIVLKYKIEEIKTTHLDDIIDSKIRSIIEERLNKDNGKIKNIDEDPVWFNQKKGLKIKTVRMRTGLKAVEPITVIDKNNNIKYDKLVKPGNNHHIALYTDADGKLQEYVCTFWHAVERKKFGIPVIIKNPMNTWGRLLDDGASLPNELMAKLPDQGLTYRESLQQNEMFLLGMNEEDFTIATQNNDRATISAHLFLVWSISESDYWFRHHLETKNSELKNTLGAKEGKRFYRFKSMGAFFNAHPIRIRLDNLGNILTGESDTIKLDISTYSTSSLN